MGFPLTKVPVLILIVDGDGLEIISNGPEYFGIKDVGLSTRQYTCVVCFTAEFDWTNGGE